MATINSSSFVGIHPHVVQLFVRLPEPRGCRVGTDMHVFQVIDPFFKRGGGDLVEFVYADEIIFGEHILGCAHSEYIAVSLA